MKKAILPLLVCLVVIVSFMTGSWYSGSRSSSAKDKVRKILYYVDPMHPAYRSDKPGTAPDCGMRLEPVYDDESGQEAGEARSGPLPPGTVKISSEQQQLINVQIRTVGKAAPNHHVRIAGRVAADETRIYRITSAIDGWVRSISRITTGSLVQKDELLANVYTPEYFSAMKAYLYALRSLGRFEESGKETKDQIELTNANIENYRNSLRNLGMTDYQLDEIRRTRKNTETIELRAPAAGFVLVRSLFSGQRFEKGLEMYRIVDLSRVWVLADAFENEARYLKPGTTVWVTPMNQQMRLRAIVSDILPQFDATSRVMKIRIEVDNPGFTLRPDMFVDVEIPVALPQALSVPADAVLDTGLRKTVFVDLGSGYFEPRKVETGWRFGDSVEIVKGLSPGERIVVSGNFLIDSESRMKSAAVAAIDPVCGHSVDMNEARTAGRTMLVNGRAHFFCSEECKQQFSHMQAVTPNRYAASGDSVTSSAEMRHHD
jgi:membrane fusion protein, copper/silver efflux system